jgi:hypothetical protein
MAVNDLHFAVVVGINRYPGIKDLKYARDDAERFRDWLVDLEGGGVPQGTCICWWCRQSKRPGSTRANSPGRSARRSTTRCFTSTGA